MALKTKLDLTKVSFRKMNGYYEAAASIDREGGENSWDVRDFWQHCRKKNCSGIVCLYKTTPVGFVTYEFVEDEIYIHNFAIRQQYFGSGLATRITAHMKNKLRCGKNALKLVVRETNLRAHLFLKKSGFLALGVVKNYFIDYYADEIRREDGYNFEFKIPQRAKSSTNKEVPVSL